MLLQQADVQLRSQPEARALLVHQLGALHGMTLCMFRMGVATCAA
jgi:hypothetical protein